MALPEVAPTPGPSSLSASLRRWVRRTFVGRALALGALIKLAAYVFQLAGGSPALAEAIDTVGDICLVAGALGLAYQLFVDAWRSLLWRVRRKLTLSYIFIGFVPALLIIAFFLISGLLVFYNISSYMMQSGVASLVDRTQALAQAAALDVQHGRTRAEAVAAAERRQMGAAMLYPEASYAVVPVERACGNENRAREAVVTSPIAAGPWSHLPPPDVLPEWVPCAGYAGLIAYAAAVDAGAPATPGRAVQTRMAVRAVAWPEEPGRHYAVIVDVPLSPAVVQRIREDTGIEIGNVTPFGQLNGEIGAARGAGVEEDPRVTITSRADGRMDPRFEWVAFLDYTNWETGEHNSAMAVAFRMGMRDILDRISGTQLTPIGPFTFGQLLLLLLAVVGGLFLVIQAVALAMGLALARSITGSVHELFAGTERLRRGDFSHKIAVRSRDQLGELADSFNSMTASMEDLLQQKAEKERMEQELRIARSIQMSLLPQGQLAIPGLAVAGHCEPAREVGGDYYDLLPLDGQRLGLLIADVAGKGTSAALYMAELKGIVLSLSQFHRSPRRLLIDADRILARHLDARSFITATYAVIDLRSRTLTYARAGHCPLIYVPGPYARVRSPQILAPDGMVLGLQLDNGEMFSRLLEESTLTLGTGDLVLLYTDGITEAMNDEGDCFGDARLAELLQQNPDRPSDEIRERILREVRAFSGSAAQQDDMTLLLLRMEEVGTPDAPALQTAGAGTEV